jgi:multicomponent Na+:H+ antiporter subunit E
MAQAESKSPYRPGLRTGWRIISLILAFSLVWFVLTGFDQASWLIGIPTVLLAVLASLFLSPGLSAPINPIAVLLFIPYFIGLSIMSGIDVLRRTFAPTPRIDPGIVTYQTGLTGSPRILLTNIISLLPGTLSADLREDEIHVHVLDADIPVHANIRNLENRISRIFSQQHPREIQS